MITPDYKFNRAFAKEKYSVCAFILAVVYQLSGDLEDIATCYVGYQKCEEEDGNCPCHNRKKIGRGASALGR
jgi:hypothetical protein